MYELIILSLLVRFPAHGYLISHIINDMIGPYARVSNGRLYPLLAKMEESGLIEAYAEDGQERHGERNARSYHITEEGRQRFYALMMDTTSNLGEYQRLFRYKAPILYLLQPFEQIYLLEHYLNYCQAHVLHLIHETNDLATHGLAKGYPDQEALAATLDVMRHVTEQWRMEVEWVQRLRTEVLARREHAEQSVQRATDTTSPSTSSRSRRQDQNQNQNSHQNDNQNQNQNNNENQHCR